MSIKNKIKYLWKLRWAWRSILSSIYFNFKYLPFKQAIRLPILLYKPHFKELTGSITIKGPVNTGMIQLGAYRVSLFPNNGITIENRGGNIVFDGSCTIGNNSFISIGKGSKLIFGRAFCASTSLKLTCYNHIKFDERVLIGWDCIVSDTDFHTIEYVSGGHSKGYGPIIIGKEVWIGMRSMIFKNTVIPDFCVISSNSLLNKAFEESYCLLGGTPVKVLKKGVHRNPYDDEVNYQVDSDKYDCK